MAINKRILQRAISKALVNDTSQVIELVNKYQPISKNATYFQLLSAVMELMDKNTEFDRKFTALLIKNKRLIDYNNAGGADPVSAIADAVSSIFKFGVSKIGANKDRMLERQELASENTKQIMQYMAQDEQVRLNDKKQETNLIYISIAAMALITITVVLAKKM